MLHGNVCDYCDQNFSCGVLQTAMEIMASEARDDAARERVLAFKNKVEGYGYSYPISEKRCWLHDKRPAVEELVQEAKALIDDMRASR